MRVYVLLAGYKVNDRGEVMPVIFLSQKYGMPAEWDTAEGSFTPFGGGREFNESEEEAANRELREEIGAEWVSLHRIPGVARPFGLKKLGMFGDLGLYQENRFLALQVDVGLASYRRLLSAVGARDEGAVVAIPYPHLDRLRPNIPPDILPAVEALFTVMVGFQHT